MMETFRMIVTAFLVIGKANQMRFFEETFLVASMSLKVVLGILFLTLSNANVDFLDWDLRWRSYTTNRALLTIKHIKLVGKKKFVTVALNLEHETYVVHVGSVSSIASPSFSPLKFDVQPFRRPQISSLIAEKAPTKIFDEYIDFADVFSPDLTSKLFEHTGINDHAIELVDS